MSRQFTSRYNAVNAPFTIPRYRRGMDMGRLQIVCEKAAVVTAYMVLAALFLAFAQPAIAQSTSTFTNTNNGVIDGTRTCTNPLVRNFNVGANFSIQDVNIGILAQHTWRGDLQFTLQSPDGTRVQLTNGDINNINGDNFNVLLDDSAGQLVNTDSATGNHANPTPFVPPYQNTFRPVNALSAFNGQNSAGTWRLEICDLFPGADDGNFRRADLYLTSAPTNFADLSLTKTLVGSPPVQGGTATWRLTVTNAPASPQTANGVVVRDTFPPGFTFSSSSGDGSFNAGTRDWSVGSLAPGESKTLTIAGSISSSAGTTVTNTAQITASSVPDIDSTVNNGATGEDDYAASSFVVQSGRAPGVPPVLSCPSGQSVFDWGSISGWTPGSTDNSYAFAGFGNVRFQLTNDGAYINNALFGGPSPNVGDYFNGGLVPAEDTLQVVSDQANRTGAVTITITLPRSFTGLQFAIHDVDFGANQFADRLVVSGSNGASTVNPTLTNGNVNFVSGNTVIGDGAAGNNEALGNVVITFTQPVDTVTIQYGNHTTAPANPGQQGIGLHDITVCDPFAALSVSKVSTVIADPVNGTTNPKAIPGATIEYLITVANSGPSATDSDTVIVRDDGPADAKMCLIARPGGPVIFVDPGSNSGLTYAYGGAGSVAGDLGVVGDDLEFSNDNGASFTYSPSDEGDGCDSRITNFRVNPAGGLASGGNFTLTVRYQVQ